MAFDLDGFNEESSAFWSGTTSIIDGAETGVNSAKGLGDKIQNLLGGTPQQTTTYIPSANRVNGFKFDMKNPIHLAGAGCAIVLILKVIK